MTSGRDYLVRRLRLRHLELLVRLSEAGTLRGAARQLNLSQPAVSKMLVEVEEAFGAALFERSRQGMRANGFGLAAIHHARTILGELTRASDELEALRAGATAMLRLGTPSVTASVPAAIVELQSDLPRVAVQIREGRAHDLVQRLLDGELDCVFGAITPEALSNGSLPLLQSEVMCDDHLCVLASTQHPLARRRQLGWADVRDARWVAPPLDTLVRRAHMAAFINEGLDPPMPVIETVSSVTIGTVLRLDADLLGAVRHEHARDELARGGVAQLRVGPTVALPPLCLFTRRGESSDTPALCAFAVALRRVTGGARQAPRGSPRASPGDSIAPAPTAG